MANHWAMKMLNKHKNCQFELGQCFTPLERLKDLYTELQQQTQDEMVGLSFSLGLVQQHIRNLPQLYLQGARDLA